MHNVPDNGEPYVGLGIGIFRANANGQISTMVKPGDTAPGGGMFDYAVRAWVNDGCDVSFIGHIAGEESVVAGFPPHWGKLGRLSLFPHDPHPEDKHCLRKQASPGSRRA